MDAIFLLTLLALFGSTLWLTYAISRLGGGE
jgi:hypothetical protein